MERPEKCKIEHLEFLDQLRELGVTNMFGAVPYLIEAFDLTRDEASKILSYWMKTFGQEGR